MQTILVFTLVLHVLSGVFWAGSTFTLVRRGVGAESLVRPQLGAAGIAVVTGAALWQLVHSGSPGKTEYIPGRRRCSACRRWRPGAVARARQWAAPSGGSSGHHRDLHGGGTVCVSSCRNSRIGSLLSPAVPAASGPVLLGCLQAKVPMS